MGVLELIEQKAFLGSEFLTWLWLRGEQGEGRIEIEGEESVEVEVVDSLTLEGPYGEATRHTLKGEAPGASPEARAALEEGKLASRAKLRLAQGEMEWSFSLRGDTFDFSAIRIPAPRGLPFDEGVSLRLQAVGQLFALMDRLFEGFLQVRLDRAAWERERESLIRRDKESN